MAFELSEVKARPWDPSTSVWEKYASTTHLMWAATSVALRIWPAALVKVGAWKLAGCNLHSLDRQRETSHAFDTMQKGYCKILQKNDDCPRATDRSKNTIPSIGLVQQTEALQRIWWLLWLMSHAMHAVFTNKRAVNLIHICLWVEASISQQERRGATVSDHHQQAVRWLQQQHVSFWSWGWWHRRTFFFFFFFLMLPEPNRGQKSSRHVVPMVVDVHTNALSILWRIIQCNIRCRSVCR